MLYKKKTAALFVASAVFAIISINGKEIFLLVLGDIAFFLGMMFQYFDDLIDKGELLTLCFNENTLNTLVQHNVNKSWKKLRKVKNIYGLASLVLFLIGAN